VLDGFAPDFIGSLFRGENGVLTRPENMEHLLGLRLAEGETIWPPPAAAPAKLTADV
jgi:hypothetical protein